MNKFVTATFLVIILVIGLADTLPLWAVDVPPSGTGTGFVVNSEGYLLTCAHVVSDAARVTVTLSAKTWDTAVLGVEELYDVALLQIPATGLTALPLANSNEIAVGQEARAFGFPLASALGEDLKVTRGTVAGISMREAKKVIQIDAAVNRGNSGGPLVNELGEVIGLVNAKLVGADVTNIGFAVPGNYAKTLLLREGVTFSSTGVAVKLDGPALVKLVSPSVALITVWGKTPTVLINQKDSAELVLIPAGEFIMGGTQFDEEKPVRKVNLDAYYIYKTEVTVAQFRQFCAATRRDMPEEPDWGWRDDHPMVNVSWNDAAAYARWAGAALPTEAQWEKAARGGDGREYPWGNVWDASKAQCSAKEIGDAGGPVPVGSFPAGASPYGVLDMAGNVWEWCADWYGVDYYKRAPANNPPGPLTGELRVLRGGSWYFSYPNGFRSANRGGDLPAGGYYFGGFRCVLRSPGQ